MKNIFSLFNSNKVNRKTGIKKIIKMLLNKRKSKKNYNNNKKS